MASIADIAEDELDTEARRVANLTDRQKAREVFNQFATSRGAARNHWATIAVQYAEFLSEKQLAWAEKFAG